MQNFFYAGDIIPADSVVISCNDLRVNELLLTGVENVKKDYRKDPFLLAGN